MKLSIRWSVGTPLLISIFSMHLHAQTASASPSTGSAVVNQLLGGPTPAKAPTPASPTANTTPNAAVPSLVGKVVKPMFEVALDEVGTNLPVVTDERIFSRTTEYRREGSAQMIQHHTSFPANTEFTITKAEAMSVAIILQLAPLNGGSSRTVRLWFVPGWQKNPQDPQTGNELMSDYALTNVFKLYLGLGISERIIAELRCPSGSIPPTSSSSAGNQSLNRLPDQQTSSNGLGESNTNNLLPTELIGTRVHPAFRVCRNFTSTQPVNRKSLILPAIVTIGANSSNAGIVDCESDPPLPNVTGSYKYFIGEPDYIVEQISFCNDPRWGSCIQIQLHPTDSAVTRIWPDESKDRATVRIMVDKNWQSRIQAGQGDIRQAILFWLPDDATIQSREQQAAAAERDRAETAKKREEIANQEKISTNQHQPIIGKPSYSETVKWIETNLPKMKIEAYYSTEIMSTSNCVLAFKEIDHRPTSNKNQATEWVEIIPLSDVLSTSDTYRVFTYDNGVQVNDSSRGDRFIYINTKHNGDFKIMHRGDYDTNELAKRLVNAINHAVALCQIGPKKSTEPF